MEPTEDPTTTTGSPDGASGPDGAVRELRAGWRRYWQVPAMAVALLGLVAAAGVWIAAAPRPDYGGTLDQADALIGQEQYSEALQLLEREIDPVIPRGVLVPEELRRYNLLAARAVYLGQRELGVDLPENRESILRGYLEAERRGASLDPSDTDYLARTLLAEGRYHEALERAESLPPVAAARRDRLLQDLVTHDLARRGGDLERAIDLLTGMLARPDLPREQRLWATARKAQIQLDQGFEDDAIDDLLRVIPRLDDVSDHERAELAMLLGEAYLASGEHDRAKEQLELAADLTDGAGVGTGRLAFLLGRVEQSMGPERLEPARDWLLEVTTNYGESPSVLPAYLGLGEVHAGLGEIEESIEAYRELVERVRDGAHAREASVERITVSLMARVAEALAVNEPADGLRFAELAERLHGDEPPAEVVLAMATSNRRLAETLEPDGWGDDRVRVEVDTATLKQVQRTYRRAGWYFREHADRVLLTDTEAYADSLWQAAESYDLAGDTERTIESFRDYAENFTTEVRNAEARFRLGRALQSQGEYERSAAVFQSIIDQSTDPNVKGVGLYADRSYVPLAQSLLLDGKLENDGQARELLEAVVSGEHGGTESETFDDALVALGRLHYADGRFERAIERLREAVERSPERPGLVGVRYRLADAYRQSAASIEETIRQGVPEQTASELAVERDDRLRRAMALFEQVRDEYSAIDPRRLTSLERLHLRNACLYLGDCAFDLEEYETAVRYYDQARERYQADPASLVALVQIVNAHVQRGDFTRARTANERARRFFNSLPSEVWDDPDLPMQRRDWERWLDSNSKLYAREAGD